jgi:type IV pilus assembly protein PilA
MWIIHKKTYEERIMKVDIAKKIKNKEGFTLVELMIVVAIIGILAAIAIPQFSAYRTRSYNANAKALNKLLVNTQSDLNAELGSFGFTDVTAANLSDAPVAASLGEIQTSVAATAVFRAPANATDDGGNLAGVSPTTGRTMRVPVGFGTAMNAYAEASGGSGGDSYILVARADQGDTAYGVDSDLPNTMYSVSNPSWKSAGTDVLATYPTGAAVRNDNDDFVGLDGGGAPTANWIVVD